jgi:hypothetical protein
VKEGVRMNDENIVLKKEKKIKPELKYIFINPNSVENTQKLIINMINSALEN